MVLSEAVGVVQIADGAGQPQASVVRAGGESELFQGTVEESRRALGERAAGLDMARSETGRTDTIACHLAAPCMDDALSNALAGFAGTTMPQFDGVESRHFYGHIDSVQQGAADAAPITRDLIGTATAFGAWIPMVAAWAWIHGGDELAIRGIGQLGGGPRDYDTACLQGLAQDLEGVALEFGKLVEEQNAVVCQ